MPFSCILHRCQRERYATFLSAIRLMSSCFSSGTEFAQCGLIRDFRVPRTLPNAPSFVSLRLIAAALFDGTRGRTATASPGDRRQRVAKEDRTASEEGRGGGSRAG